MSQFARCQVVEIPVIQSPQRGDLQLAPRDLVPWADPYIAQLAQKYRLQAALDDSIEFVRQESRRPRSISTRDRFSPHPDQDGNESRRGS